MKERGAATATGSERSIVQRRTWRCPIRCLGASPAPHLDLDNGLSFVPFVEASPIGYFSWRALISGHEPRMQ